MQIRILLAFVNKVFSEFSVEKRSSFFLSLGYFEWKQKIKIEDISDYVLTKVFLKKEMNFFIQIYEFFHTNTSRYFLTKNVNKNKPQD